MSNIERWRKTVVFYQPRIDCESPDAIGPRVVIFCHFDKEGRIRDHTKEYIQALRQEALDLIFVSNSTQLRPNDLSWLRCQAPARIILRRNVGYDFGAWRDALITCQLPRKHTALICLANDSVYGPLQPLGAILERMDFGRAGVWAATDSWQHRFHLQSYFLAFGPSALASETFLDFWQRVRQVRSKGFVVRHYELGLTRAFLKAGLRCRAIWPYTEAIEVVRKSYLQAGLLLEAGDNPAYREDQGENKPKAESSDFFAEAARINDARIIRAALRHIPRNPTADLWRTLVEQRMPFVKRELLRINPTRVPGVAAWPIVIGAHSTYDTDLILRDLENSAKDRTP